MDPSRAKRMIQLAQKYNGLFSTPAMNELFGQNSAMSIANNPKFSTGAAYTLVVMVRTFYSSVVVAVD